MGAKHGKSSKEDNRSSVLKAVELSETDYQFLMHQTGQTRAEIKHIFDKFSRDNNDLKLKKSEFVRLYIELRPERPETLDEIAEHIFEAFDVDKNGTIDFHEFMVRIKKITSLIRFGRLLK
jgi:Ca2+-binding EF-hand superfamily protein